MIVSVTAQRPPPPVVLYLGCSNRCPCLFAANFPGFITHNPRISKTQQEA